MDDNNVNAVGIVCAAVVVIAFFWVCCGSEARMCISNGGSKEKVESCLREVNKLSNLE